MKLLPKVKDKQPIRTLGEFRQFTADLSDDTLLSGFTQYGDEEAFPVTVVIVQPDDGNPGHWLDCTRIHIAGYECYSGDPDLEATWGDTP